MICRNLLLIAFLTSPFVVHAAIDIGSNRTDSGLKVTDSFATCILTMDDNHRLIEWLSYHYHTLPLRRVIIMTDQRSKTSPSPILERWEKYMKIDLWSDKDVFSEDDLKNRTHDGMINLHRSRQRAFNIKCMQTLRDEGATWTLMTDVDEFLYINPRAWDPSEPLYQNNIVPIPIEEPGSILKMLSKIDFFDDRNHAQEWQACLPVSRLQFGGIESLPEEVNNKFPKELQPSLLAQDFETFRWRYYGVDDVTARGGVIPGKTIIDVSAVPEKELWRFIGDPHRPIDKLCKGGNVWLNNTETVFIANHVLGTMEQYASRDDSRLLDRVLTYERRKNIGGNLSDKVRPWLDGFIKEMGVKEAHRLLVNTGQVQTKTFELPRCSINFFGLPRSFKTMALPSIVKNVLHPNAKYSCDIFVHYYNIDHEDEERYNRGGNIDSAPIYDLKIITEVIAANAGKKPPAVIIKGETKEEFSAKYGDLVKHYQTTIDPDTGKLVYFPWADVSYKSPKQIENIVMQWKSIQSVWDEMEKYAKNLGIEYKRVGFFRLDAFYALPVDIYQMDKYTYDYANRYAVIPAFAKHPVNDRMIYGPAEAVKIWATERFHRLQHHISTYEVKGYGMHSERYMDHEILPAITRETGHTVIENVDICFYRTRASDSVLITDCQDAKGGTTRGILDMNQTQIVEDLVERNCIKAPLDDIGRFVELRCDSTIQMDVTEVSIRRLKNNETTPPYQTTSPTPPNSTLSISPSLQPSVRISDNNSTLSVSPSLQPSVRISDNNSTLSVSPSLQPTVRISDKPSINQSAKPSIDSSATPSKNPSACPLLSVKTNVVPTILCAANEKPFLIQFLTDAGSKWQNTIVIRTKNKWGWKKILKIKKFSQCELYQHSMCLDKNSCTRFILIDKKKNGLRELSYYKLYWGGEKVNHDRIPIGMKKQIVEFGNCDK